MSRPPNTSLVASVLGSVTGIVAATPDATWRALLAILPELGALDATTLGQLEQPRSFTVQIGHPTVATASVDVDPLRREVSQKGEWWYQGIVTVAPHAEGSSVTRMINNVAPGWTRWLVPFVHRHSDLAMRSQHEALLRALGARLGCRAALIANVPPASGGSR